MTRLPGARIKKRKRNFKKEDDYDWSYIKRAIDEGISNLS
jgi:hypothetical protein